MRKELVPKNLLEGTLFGFQAVSLARLAQKLPVDGLLPS
jgi:hypothetical protein